jgi:hypothetical protein
MEKRLKIKVDGNWRSNPRFFQQHKDFQYKSGTVDFALAWYQQAMEVSGFSFIQISIFNHIIDQIGS